MKHDTTLRAAVAVFISLLFCIPVLAAQRDDIKASMKERYPLLTKMKEAGKIGETHLGFVEATSPENAKDAKVQEVVNGENGDRQHLYQIIAKDTDTTPELVGKNNALRIFKKAGEDELFKGADGKWRAKKDVVVEKAGE